MKEFKHQITCADWLRNRRVQFIHVPNEGKRTVIAGRLLKLMGMVPGAADFIVFGRPDQSWFPGICAELKKPVPLPERGRPLKLWDALHARGHQAWCDLLGRPAYMEIVATTERGLFPLPPEPLNKRTGKPMPLAGWPSNAQTLWLEQQARLGWRCLVGWGSTGMINGMEVAMGERR
jgi:hypothetical protein